MMWKSLFVILVMRLYTSAAAHDDSQMIRNDDKQVVHAIEGAVLAGSEVPGEGKERELLGGKQHGLGK